MKRIAKKDIISRAHVNATKATSVTYFPFPEYVEKIAYSAGVYGWTGSLYQGQDSGVLYAVTDCGNDCACNGYNLRNSFGNREREIVRNLVDVVEEEHKGTKHSVLRFIARDGYSFTAATFDHGRTWSVCG